MKKSILSAIVLLLALALLAGCGKPQAQLPDPTKSTAEIPTAPT